MKEKGKSNVFIKSILVIISYFALPYVISLISKSNMIDTMLYLLYAFILIFLYKQVFISDFKDIKKNWKKYLMRMLISIVLIFVSMVLINLIVGVLFNVKEISENDFSLLTTFKENSLVVVLLTCIYYPLVEGIIFRKSVRDIIDNKWFFIMFSAIFYFFFNIVYTSMSFSNIMSSVCYLSTMMIVSHFYWKTNNFTLSVLVMSIFNFVVCLLSFM